MLCFDYDETLISTTSRQYSTLMDIFKRKEISILNFEHFLYLRENGKKIFEIVKRQPEVSDELAREVEIEWINNIEQEHYQKLDKPLNDATSILKLVKEITPICIISARQNHELLCRSAHYNFEIDQANIHSVNPLDEDVAVGKSKLLTMLNATGFIGDSFSDEKAASLSNTPFLHSKFLSFEGIIKWLDTLGID